MKILSLSIFIFFCFQGALLELIDPNTAEYRGCVDARGEHSCQVNSDGFVPGLFVVSSNMPGGTYNRDGSLAKRKIVCAHQDKRTSGGSVVVQWSSFDKRDGKGGGYFDWTFVDKQMKPWIERNQTVNLLVWPAVQKKSQLFEGETSATPDYIMDRPGMSFLCPTGSAQGGVSEGIPLPMFWKPEVYLKYAQALKQFVKRYQDHDNVNYFRFGIGVGAESYPANGATTHNNYCMQTFVNQFDGSSYEEKAMNAYQTWTDYAIGRVRAFRRFNSKKHIIVTVNDFATLRSIEKTKFPNMIATEATWLYRVGGVEQKKLGLGVQGATANDIRLWDDNERCPHDWCRIFDDAKNFGVPLQLQTPLHSGVNGLPGPNQSFKECKEPRKNNGKYGCTNTGYLPDLIAFALARGVKSFELYAYEWTVANDQNWKKDPDYLNWYKIHGEEYRTALDNATNQALVVA